jgi:hypothetical protein
MSKNDIKLEKQARTVYVGWKHLNKFKITPTNKDGGTRILDLPTEVHT